MSSNRKKIIEPWEIVGETCGSPTKIAMFACFCPSKKPLFSLFLQILPFPAENSKQKYVHSIMVNKPDILRPMSSKLTKEEYPKKSVTDGQKKNNVLFCSCDDVIEPNEIKLRPFVPLCGRSFLAKRFFKSVYPFQRYCLKTVSSAHRPTL